MENFLYSAVMIALFILSFALIATLYRVIVGPTLPDRVIALDMLVSIAIGYIAVIGIMTGFNLYVDIAIALGLVGFLATVAFARFILAAGLSSEDNPLANELMRSKADKAVRADRADRADRATNKGAE